MQRLIETRACELEIRNNLTMFGFSSLCACVNCKFRSANDVIPDYSLYGDMKP